MDRKVIAWARAVKSRRRATASRLPVLWAFTDPGRSGGDPRDLAHIPRALLPPGLFGVVFRHDGAPDRIALARQLATLCRARGWALSVAGNPGLVHALRAQAHLRGGQGRSGRHGTSSAHSVPELVRARRAGVALVFLSPLWPTASHPGGRALGAARWTWLAGKTGLPCIALGGVDRSRIRAVPKRAAGVAGIGFVAG